MDRNKMAEQIAVLEEAQKMALDNGEFATVKDLGALIVTIVQIMARKDEE